jgi:hypothetical protein
MELNFVQSSEVFGKNTLAWETEFEATGDFNLHVERNKGGDILVYQRTAGSGYAIVEEFRGMDNKPAIDLDFTSVVYPKFVKIVSESQPTYATVTTDGEITEIKSQSKEVEVTANGTMDITPDAGFSYLNSVKVKTNVPTSGEGGGSASSVEYLDVTKLDEDMRFSLINSSSLVKWKNPYSGDVCIYPVLFARNEAYDLYQEVEAIAIDFSAIVSATGDSLGSIKELISRDNGYSLEMLDSIPRITEAEFYNLNA